MRDAPQALMLFAAGFGTRMGALTQAQPKPMIEVAGRPLIDHALELAAPLRLPRVVANLHYRPETLAAHLSPKGVALSVEAPDILETGGGLRHALPLLGAGPVFTLNTDAVWHGENPMQSLLEAWDPARMDALLMCIPKAQAMGHKGQGDFILAPDGRAARGAGLIYGGAQIIKTDLLTEVPETAFSLNVLWDRMLRDGRLFGMAYGGRWCDVGHPQGIKDAEAMIGYRA